MGSHLSTIIKYVFDFILGSGTPDDLEPGQRERAKAANHARERGSCFDRSKQCYSQGDHAGAKEWSQKGRNHDVKEKEFNSKASKLIFQHHNKDRDVDVIDLHGLFVREAVVMVQEHIRLCKKLKIKRFTVIVGKGLHSHNGIAKLRPAIMELVEENQVKCSVDQRNDGCLFVEFVEKKEQVGIFDLSETCTVQ